MTLGCPAGLSLSRILVKVVIGMSSATATCPQCQTEIQPGMLRCRNCGSRLPKTSAPSEFVKSPPARAVPSEQTQLTGQNATDRKDQPAASYTSGGTSIPLDAIVGAHVSHVDTPSAASVAPSSQETSRSRRPVAAGTATNSASQSSHSSLQNIPASVSKTASSILEQPTGVESVTSLDERLPVTCVCAAKFRVKPELAGKRIKCPKCGQGLTVPGSSDQPTATVSGRIARPELPSTSSFETLAQEISAIPPQMAEVPELKERLGKSKLKKFSDAIQKKNAEGKAEAEQRRQEILKLGTSADSRVAGLLEPLVSDYWISVREGVAEALGELRDPAGLPLLVRLLGDEVPDVKRVAIVSLGKIGDARAVGPLIEVALQEPLLRYTAGESIVRIGKFAVPALLEILKGSDPSRVLEAVIVLGRIKDPSAADAVSTLLSHRFAIVRGHAAETLGQLAEPKSSSALIRALSDQDSVVRAQAAAALLRIPDKRAIKPLIKLLEDKDVDVCVRAATALGEFGDADAAISLLPLLDRDEPEIRGAVSDALGKIGSEVAAEPLTKLFQDEDEQVRLKAVSAFRRFKSDAATAPLLQLLDDASVAIRQRAADALGEAGNRAALDRLISMLRTDPAVEVRMAAAKALGQLKSANALKVLEEALDDEMTVRCRAIVALGEIGDASSLPALLAMLKDLTPEVRYHASQSLADLGHQNSRKPLEELLGDENPMVRRGAAKALIKLGDPRGDALLEDAAKPRKARRQFQVGDYVPDWLMGVLAPSSGNFLPMAIASAAILLVGIGAWFFGGALSSLMKAPNHALARGDALSVAFSPDAKTVAVGRSRGLVEIWDVTTGKKRASHAIPRLGGAVNGITFGPDGKSLFIFSGLEAFQLSGSQFQPLPSLSSNLQFIAMTPERGKAVTFSQDGSAYVWDLTAGKVESNFQISLGAAPVCFALAADASRFAVGDDSGKLLIVDVATASVTGELKFPQNRRPVAIGFSSDGKGLLLVQIDGVVSLIDAMSRQTLAKIPFDPNIPLATSVFALPGEPSQAVIVAGQMLRIVSLPDLAIVREISDLDVGPAIHAVSDDRKLMVGAGYEESAIFAVDLDAGLPGRRMDER